MKRFIQVCILILSMLSIGMVRHAQKVNKYRCLVQMASYTGEGAYIVISLIDSKGAYEKTLYVMGPDKEWYKSWKEWHKAQAKKPENLNGITGASVTGGDRTTCVIQIDESKLNKGYKLRFESAVEDKDYFVTDVEVPLTTAGLAAKTDGKGYIRYVRLSAL